MARPSAARRPHAAAGQVVLNQSDLLVVVWDGGGAGGLGGTVEDPAPGHRLQRAGDLDRFPIAAWM